MSNKIYILIILLIFILITIFIVFKLKKTKENYINNTGKNGKGIFTKLNDIDTILQNYKNNMNLDNTVLNEYLESTYNLLIEVFSLVNEKILFIPGLNNKSIFNILDKSKDVFKKHTNYIYNQKYDKFIYYIDDYSKTPYGYYDYYLNNINNTITSKKTYEELEKIYKDILEKLENFDNEFDYIIPFYNLLEKVYLKTINTFERIHYYNNKNFNYNEEYMIKKLKTFLDKNKSDSNIENFENNILEELEKSSNDFKKDIFRNVISKLQLYDIKYKDQFNLNILNITNIKERLKMNKKWLKLYDEYKIIGNFQEIDRYLQNIMNSPHFKYNN